MLCYILFIDDVVFVQNAGVATCIYLESEGVTLWKCYHLTKGLCFVGKTILGRNDVLLSLTGAAGHGG